MRLNCLSRSSSFWFFFAIIFLLLAYLPDFVSVFGMHNDLSLPYKLPPWPHFSETDALLVLGRPVGALLVNIPYHTVYRLEDLGVWRFISFLTMLLFLAVLWFYLEKKWRLKRPWACAVTMSVAFLPASVLAVTWVCQWSAGSLVSLLAALTYLLWDQSRSAGRLQWLSVVMVLLAFFLFQVLMYTYPVGALLVFAFTFGYVLWYSGGLNQLRKIVFGDVIFFGAGVIVYRLTERFWVTPWFVSRTSYVSPLPEYQMEMTKNILSRAGLVGELFNVSVAGTWHLFAGTWGGVCFWLIVMSGCLGMVRIVFRRFNILQAAWHRFAGYGERFFYLFGLFLLGNAPMILAGGVTKVTGYRVVVVGSIMASMVFWWALRFVSFVLPRNCRFFSGTLSAVMIGVCGAMVCVHLMDVAKNYQEEESFVETAVRSWDPAAVQHCVFVKFPPGKTFLNRRMPYEFSYMITDPQHFAPLVLRGEKDRPATKNKVICYVMAQEEAARVGVRPDVFFIDPNQPAIFYEN